MHWQIRVWRDVLLESAQSSAEFVDQKRMKQKVNGYLY